MWRHIALAVALAGLAGLPTTAHAFCGFYVAKADTALFNQASKVVLVRDAEEPVTPLRADDLAGAARESLRSRNCINCIRRLFPNQRA